MGLHLFSMKTQMQKVRMTALRAQYYDRDLNVGDTFEASAEHAELLERAGSAERETKSKSNTYNRRDMRAKTTD